MHKAKKGDVQAMKNLIINRRARVALIGMIVLALAGWGTSALAITWGEPDVDNKYPNVGAFIVERDDGRVWATCTGTLIHERAFLTAGHCTDYVNGLDDEGRLVAAYVSFDFDVAPENDPTKFKVVEIITHPDYFWGGENPHDVGLLILEEAVTDIELATLPDEGFLDGLKRDGELRSGGPEGAKFTVVGYGGMLEYWWHGSEPMDGYAGDPPVGHGEEPEHIVYEDQRRFGESEYAALTPVWLHMDQNQIHDNDGTCFGDSGGPAFWESDGEEPILVGITSWGDGACVVAAFDYRVDIPDTLGFIDDVIDNLPPE
jgi:secreted trypsin-like serine protease